MYDDELNKMTESAKRVLIGTLIGAAVLAITMVCAAAAEPGRSFSMSVGRLNELCKSSDPTALGTCMGFVAGVVDAGNGVHYCLPPGLELSKIRWALVVALSGAEKEQLPAPANSVIISILHGAHQCPKRGDGPAPLPQQQRNQRSRGLI